MSEEREDARGNSYKVASPPLGSESRTPLSISRRYDHFLATHSSKLAIDRSLWVHRVLKANPAIREFRECVNPIARAAMFARLYLPQSRLVSHKVVLALISQHFRTLGLSEAQELLNREVSLQTSDIPQSHSSQLAFLLQRGIHRVERFLDLTIPSVHALPTEKATRLAIDEEISRTIGAAPHVHTETKSLLEETPEDPEFIRFDEKKEPVEASLNQLIYWITSTEHGDTTELRKALCLTISSYTTPKSFFQRLVDRFSIVFEQIENETTEYKRKPLRQSVIPIIDLMRDWLASTMGTMEDQTLAEVKEFVDTQLMPGYQKYCTDLFARPIIQQTELQGFPKVDLGNCKGLWTGDFELTDLPALELARQFTVWSSTKYNHIKREELLDCAWTTPRLRYRAPNVIALQDHGNLVANWVADSILMIPRKKDRIARMKYFIELAHHLYQLRNYYDAINVLGGFDSNALYRMPVHFSILPQASKDLLEQLRSDLSTEHRCANIRALQDKGHDDGVPLVPNISIFLGDLFTYDDATVAYVDSLINVRKLKTIYKLITKIEMFQDFSYNLLGVDQVQTKIEQIKMKDEDMLIERSMEVERDGATENDLLDIQK